MNPGKASLNPSLKRLLGLLFPHAGVAVPPPSESLLMALLREALQQDCLLHLPLLLAVVRVLKPEIERWVAQDPTDPVLKRAWRYAELTSSPARKDSGLAEVSWMTCTDLQHTVSFHAGTREPGLLLTGSRDLGCLLHSTEHLDVQRLNRLLDRWAAWSERIPPRWRQPFQTHVLEQEILASYALEGERPQHHEVAGLVHDLQNPHLSWASARDLLHWHQRVLSGLRKEYGFRRHQNFVGETLRTGEERVVYVCPRPVDVRTLMRGWFHLQASLTASSFHPVISASLLGFSLVFIHPFMDGNGRLHRLVMLHHLMHQSSRKLLPLPLSVAIARHRFRYEEVLDHYSSSVMPFIPHIVTQSGALLVTANTLSLYQTMDLTGQIGFLVDMLEDALEVDLPALWRAFLPLRVLTEQLKSTLHWPEHQCRTLARILLQNKGKLSKTKRKQYPQLDDVTLTFVEALAQQSLEATPLEP